jgi:hypothetical protein
MSIDPIPFTVAPAFEKLGPTFPPVKARALPCEVVRVRRLDRQWYAVLFYTDTYWGQGACK